MRSVKRVLITGITGQDGYFLANWLLSRNYEVFGFVRNLDGASQFEALKDRRINFIVGDITNPADIGYAITKCEPNEIYNLASQSRPSVSWSQTSETLLVNGLAAVNLFEAVRQSRPDCRVYHASSSEMFGRPSVAPQNEKTAFNPVNPYAAAKVYAHQMAKIYRESYGLYIACGILFNHESERRPLYFLTQKVAYGAACAALNITTSPHMNETGKPIVNNGKLALGSLGIARDWGYAADFVEAMWLMLQQPTSEDFVIGTGKLHTLNELCQTAYASVGKDWAEYVVTDPALLRPAESGQTVADPSYAQSRLDWRPRTTFREMVVTMVEHQIQRLSRTKNRTS